MSYSYLSNVELKDALEHYFKVLQSIGTKGSSEEINVKDSFGRVTFDAVYAKISSPHYNACAMDGIALSAARTFGATETTPVMLQEGLDFVRVDTGDALPGSFDSVIMIEDVIEMGDGKVKLIAAAAPWEHIRQIGEDICANEMILASKTSIEAAAIGAMLAGGVTVVKVWRKPVVGIIPTGDEVVNHTDNPKTGEIIEFNSSVFSAMLQQWNAVPKVYETVKDRFELIKNAIKKASEECDAVIINAGSSAGREDFSAKAISETGELILHGIAIKPGKPTILGRIGIKPVIGVPGYPVSGIIVMDSIVKPVLGLLNGMDTHEGITIKATLSRKLISSLKYEEFVRVKLSHVGDRFVATPLNRGAGVITSFVRADGVARIPINSEGCEAGANLDISLLRNEEEIKNTLTIVGSHDPLIDTVSDLMRRNFSGQYVSSAHVGSMGGIMAIKRSEAHMAGIHLLDECTGEYNESYIRKYLGSDRIARIKGVRRTQGLMTAPGNPLNIRSLSDVCGGLRYVNRQKGSGTRILLDYLLKKENIDISLINGYDREEFTHMSVAALIDAGSADTGMGILSAARIYDLDFIPVYEEQYDFILPEDYLEKDIVQNFIGILKSEDFKNTLRSMGGYGSEGSGEIYDA